MKAVKVRLGQGLRILVLGKLDKPTVCDIFALMSTLRSRTINSRYDKAVEILQFQVFLKIPGCDVCEKKLICHVGDVDKLDDFCWISGVNHFSDQIKTVVSRGNSVKSFQLSSAVEFFLTHASSLN